VAFRKLLRPRLSTLGWLLMLAGASCGRANKPQSIPRISSSAVQGSKAPPAGASASELPEGSWVPRGTEERVKELQAALRADDRLRFAEGLRYPVRVNTMSWCEITFRDAAELAPHFEHVVTPKVRAAILDATQPYAANYEGVMLGRGELWLAHGHDSINSESWNIPGMPCANWQLEPIPDWLNGTFAYSSLAEDQGTIDRDAPSRWFGATLTVDLKRQATHGGLEHPQPWECRPLRFGYDLKPPEKRSLGAYANGFGGDLAHPYFFDLLCPNSNGQMRIERFEVMSRSLLANQANDGFLIFLARVSPGRPITHHGATDQDCGGAEQCRTGFVCVAQQETAPTRSTCRPSSTLGWCDPAFEKSNAGRAFCAQPSSTP
jgi:hypothetical protein